MEPINVTCQLLSLIGHKNTLHMYNRQHVHTMYTSTLLQIARKVPTYFVVMKHVHLHCKLYVYTTMEWMSAGGEGILLY